MIRHTSLEIRTLVLCCHADGFTDAEIRDVIRLVLGVRDVRPDAVYRLRRGLGLAPNHECRQCGTRFQQPGKRYYCLECQVPLTRAERSLRYIIARAVFDELYHTSLDTYWWTRESALQQWPWLRASIERHEAEGRLPPSLEAVRRRDLERRAAQHRTGRSYRTRRGPGRDRDIWLGAFGRRH